jgi:voltage-gated sodium channel
VFEIVARMIVHRAKFWTDPWSLFNRVAVAITLMPATGNLSVLRALRILRVLRLVTAFSSIRHVVTGLLNAIPGMGSILFLLVLINYIFAVLTTKLYGANFPKFFGTIGASFYTLFQIMTLEGGGLCSAASYGQASIRVGGIRTLYHRGDVRHA